jgi:hypothetical protein
MHSHTSITMSFGKGTIYSNSTKQKMNIQSSTKVELVAVNDTMSQILWTKYFMEAQGYKIKDNLLYQDNKSAILLENNGHGSSSKQT